MLPGLAAQLEMAEENNQIISAAEYCARRRASGKDEVLYRSKFIRHGIDKRRNGYIVLGILRVVNADRKRVRKE